MKYGFEKITCEIPNTKGTIKKIVFESGYGMFMMEKLRLAGLKYIPQNTDYSFVEFINQAVLKVIYSVTDFEKRIKGVILAHSLPIYDMRDPSFLDNCLKDVSLDNAFKIAISGQPCAILHQALQIAISWLSKEDEDKGILLIGADQVGCSKDRIFFNSVMGDAVFTGFISSKARNNIILSSVTETEIIACEGEKSNQTDINNFLAKNPYLIRKCIEQALLEAKINIDEIRYIIPHTPYRRIWDIVALLMQIPREKILDDYIVDTGHLNSNDSFCHYIRAYDEKRLSENDIVVLTNPGFGGSRGCTVIRV